MNLYIVSKEFENNSSNLFSIEEGVSCLVIRESKDFFEYGGNEFSFKNLVELVSCIEKTGLTFNNAYVYGGFLKFSSEINVRFLFSVINSLFVCNFKYYDFSQNLKDRATVLNRCFKSLDLYPCLDKFTNNISYLTFKDFDSKLLWHYSEKMRLIEYNKVSTTLVIDDIKAALKNKKPFSFIRLNHCENRLLGYDYTFPYQESEITYDIQFGYKLDKQETAAISNLIKNSVKKSDYLGVPVYKTRISKKLHILENSTYIHLRDFGLWNNQQFCDVNIHYDFGKSNEFLKILINSKRLFAITCRRLSKIQNIINKKINIISIPGESRFTEENNLKHYPNEFKRVRRVIQENIKPGDLVLVGGGILGKIYCDIVKSNGGVALDVGSLMDAMENLTTRGDGFGNGFWWQ
ncbi:hypothetical protein [Endozoicomonas sp. ONNA1]|uniref:GT-D fold domain-containing protein n=1 Tax=Endozoicomonas sp. ONNA1 TaxID=2828740 RepID=UPI002148E095|nr:hypothetical protein [Endozoicomonas sp. ONNA1]